MESIFRKVFWRNFGFSKYVKKMSFAFVPVLQEFLFMNFIPETVYSGCNQGYIFCKILWWWGGGNGCWGQKMKTEGVECGGALNTNPTFLDKLL